jgi:hypothetical protein
MITHIYPLSRVQEAFDLRNDKSPACEAIHVLIDCQTESTDVVRPSHEVAAGAPSAQGAPRGASTCC